MTKVDRIAEELRHEPYRVLPMKYTCIGKSLRFKRECLRTDIKAKVVICLGIVKTRRLGFLIKMPMMHAWGEVNNKRIEVTRPLDKKSPWGTFDIDLIPVIAIRF